VDGANRHDIKLLEETLRSIVVAHPLGMNVCLDAGYAGPEELVERPGYQAHIRGRGEGRRVAEVCHSWLNRFRKLLVRYEKKAGNYLALLHFACAIILWRQIIPVHPGLIPG
jgi:transposase